MLTLCHTHCPQEAISRYLLKFWNVQIRQIRISANRWGTVKLDCDWKDTDAVIFLKSRGFGKPLK